MHFTPALFVLAAALTLAACAQRTRPPGEVGVCYHVVPQADGSMKYNKLVDAPNLETCAANLEAMRVRFLRMGAASRNYMGPTRAISSFWWAGGDDLDVPGGAPIRRSGTHRRRAFGHSGSHAEMKAGDSLEQY